MNTEWDDYFELRKVAPKDYESISLPAYLRQQLPSDLSARIYDIGCGFGQGIRGCAALGYKNVVGIEPSESAVRHVREMGFEVLHGVVQEMQKSTIEPADFGYMSHVLEHINKNEVVPTLEAIRTKVLKPNARLLVVVPNAQSFTGPYWRYEDWTHHTLFTSGSLQYVMRAAGFKDIKIVDPFCLDGVSGAKRIVKKLLLQCYAFRYKFWCKVTGSATHKTSINVFSFEVKAIGTA